MQVVCKKLEIVLWITLDQTWSSFEAMTWFYLEWSDLFSSEVDFYILRHSWNIFL